MTLAADRLGNASGDLSAAACFVASPSVRVHCRAFDDHALIYEEQSGDTIDLTALEGAIVLSFDDEPRSIDTIVSRLAEDVGGADLELIRPRVVDLVEQLLAKGWIHPHTMGS